MPKCSDVVVEMLDRAGVTAVFELSGGMITYLLDSLSRSGRIRVVSLHHEQAAAFAADAYGRMTGVPGVAMATSGPGATNLLTGIGSSYFDSSPSVFITGQVNRDEQKGERSVRQLGFQETDIVSMARPVTKAAWLAQNAEEVPGLLCRALTLSRSGRPGPVLLDLPMDVQRAEIADPDLSPEPADTLFGPALNVEVCWRDEIEPLIRRAQRPLILAGGGIRSGRATSLFVRWAEAVQIPVLHTLMAVDVLPYAHPLRVGMIGTYGNRWANVALGRSDLLLVMGSRLDVRQTGSCVDEFKAGRDIVHVDCEIGEINNRIKGCVPVVSDIGTFLQGALRAITGVGATARTTWMREISELHKRWPDENEQGRVSGINPNRFMHALSRASDRAGAYLVDVGQHQMWAAQSLELNASQRFLTSGGMGSMGFALPAAVGAWFAMPSRPLVVIAGDGGFQCNIQELQTVMRNRIPLKIVVINNNCHGMVRQFQEAYFESRFQSTVWGYSAPDFELVAKGYGLAASTIREESEVGPALAWLWREPMGPALLNVLVDTATNVLPKVMFGRAITEMSPPVRRRLD